MRCAINRLGIRGFVPSVLVLAVFIGLSFTSRALSQGQQKSSSIVIHDNTKPSNGGERATEGLRNEFGAALGRDKPCVETFDDQDLRDAIDDERERELLEGGDSDAALKAIGDKLNSRLVMSVQALPGPGGSTVYSAFVIDTKTGQTIARRMGGEKEVAESIAKDIGSYLADNCKPHWAGTIRLVYLLNETKTTRDGGAAHAARRNVKRENTQTSNMQTNITATLLDPAAGGSLNSPMARVVHKTQFEFTKTSKTTGENLCREPGKNPYFKGFSEEYTETTTQIGRGTDNMPVFIEIDDDGSYTIKVTAPGGTLLGKIDTRQSRGTCADSNPTPSIEVNEMPEGKLMPTSFDAEGKTDAKQRDSLQGSQTLPDGKTTISWNLRLVKPKGK